MHLAGQIALYPISARRAGAARRVGAGVAIPAPPNQEWHRESDRCKKRNCIVMQECIVRLGESDALLLSCRHSHGWAGGGRVTECHRGSPPGERDVAIRRSRAGRCYAMWMPGNHKKIQIVQTEILSGVATWSAQNTKDLRVYERIGCA